MAPKVFGVMTEYMSYVAFLLVILTFGLETTYFRFAKEDKEEASIFSQLFTYMFCGAAIVCCGLFFLAPFIKPLLKESGNIAYIQLVSLILFLDVFSALPFARLRNLNKPLRFVIVKLSSIGINIGLNFLFIYLLPQYYKVTFLSFGPFYLDLNDQIYSILIANVIANSIFIVAFYKDLKTLFQHWSSAYVKPVLKYAYPVMILGLAGVINEMLDRLMLKEILPYDFYSDLGINSLGAVGIYSANYKFAIFITLAIQAYRYAAEPFFFKTEKEKDSKHIFAQLMTVFTVMLLCMAVFITLFRQEIGVLILRKEIYREGLVVVPILLLANVCVGIYYNLSAWYKLTDKTIYGTIIGVSGAVITIIMNIILIPFYGFLGSAIATLVCYGIMMVWSYLLGQNIILFLIK